MQALSWETSKENNLIPKFQDNDYLEFEEDRDYCHNGRNNPIYTNHHSLPKNLDKNIRKDLEKIGLPINIINLADDIYKEMKAGTKRGKRRKQLIYFCVSTAYNKLSIPIDPNKLAKLCGIDYSDISKAQSMCSPSKTNYEPPLRRFTPLDFIPNYFKAVSNWLNFPEDTLDDIIAIAEDILDSEPDLKDEKPQTVAAGIIVFYLNVHGLSLDKDKYTEIFGRSDMTINKIKNKVSLAFNK